MDNEKMTDAIGKESPHEVARRVAMVLTAQLANSAPIRTPSERVAPAVVSPQRQLASTQHASQEVPASATAYISMLPYAYTNSDVAQLFSQFGKLARVTILRDKQTRKSRGVAFVQFARSEDCARAVEEMHDTELEGFRLACSISRDNGRSQEFARKRKYTAESASAGNTSMSRCFECGEFGHFSYKCPRNVLGDRERPAQTKQLKNKKKRFNSSSSRWRGRRVAVAAGVRTSFEPSEPGATSQRKRKALGSYFSDESASDEDDGDRNKSR